MLFDLQNIISLDFPDETAQSTFFLLQILLYLPLTCGRDPNGAICYLVICRIGHRGQISVDLQYAVYKP